MENVLAIRHKHYVEKIGVRRIFREMGIDRKTVRKYLTESAPVRHEPDPRSRPVMATVGPRVDEILEDWKTRTTKKQRVTSSRMHGQLLAEGYEVGERTVRGTWLRSGERPPKSTYRWCIVREMMPR